MNNFKKVEQDDKDGRVWLSLGRDKYGRIMVSPKTREWRGTTFGEFYGGPGVYDYSIVKEGRWSANALEHPVLQRMQKDFKQLWKDGKVKVGKSYPISLGVVD